MFSKENTRYIILQNGRRISAWIHPYFRGGWRVIDGTSGMPIFTGKTFQSVSNWVDRHRARKPKPTDTKAEPIKRHSHLS